MSSDFTIVERQVLEAIDCGKDSPTAVGLYCGKSYDTASSWACPVLKRLVNRGVLQVSKKGRIVTYKRKQV